MALPYVRTVTEWIWGPRPPVTPRLPLSLRRLVREVGEAWPHRLQTSDGWIGDRLHAARTSDHNPDWRGIVHAVDLTSAQMRPWVVVTAAILHPSTRYVIYDRVIWSRSYGMRPHRYEGSNPHTTHVHISVLNTRAAETSRRRWIPREW